MTSNRANQKLSYDGHRPQYPPTQVQTSFRIETSHPFQNINETKGRLLLRHLKPIMSRKSNNCICCFIEQLACDF